jgi:hypothetical protein
VVPENLVRIATRLLPKLTGEHLGDCVGVPHGEGVEAIAFLRPLATMKFKQSTSSSRPKPAGEREDLSIKLVVGLAVDEDEAASIIVVKPIWCQPSAWCICTMMPGICRRLTGER